MSFNNDLTIRFPVRTGATQNQPPPIAGFKRGLVSLTAALFCLALASQDPLMVIYQEGRFEEVIRNSAAALEAGDSAYSTFYLKALAEGQMGRTLRAVETLESALRVYPDHPVLVRSLALIRLEAGDFPGALQSFQWLVSFNEQDLSAWLKIAEISQVRQDFRKAENSYRRVLGIDSTNLEALMGMAGLLNRRGDTTAADYYHRVLEHAPRNQKAAYELANWYIREELPDFAIPLCQQILWVDSVSIRFRKLLGFAHYRAGDPQPAIEAFQSARNLGDSTAFTYKFLGISHYLAVEYTDAARELEHAVARDSMDAEVHFFLGSALAQSPEKARAMKHLNRSLELMAPDPKVVSRIYAEKGYIRRLEEKYEEAYELYRSSWEADSTHPIALYYMASILDNSLHRSADALADYQHFIRQLDNQPAASRSQGQIPTIREIVEDRIIAIQEELFFLDED